uniref:Uncharacterized protein n=1 Tax=Cacopsylla melanoneura TaxID=428564 RepID=A0A8D8W3L5_9HEMI
MEYYGYGKHNYGMRLRQETVFIWRLNIGMSFEGLEWQLEFVHSSFIIQSCMIHLTSFIAALNLDYTRNYTNEFVNPTVDNKTMVATTQAQACATNATLQRVAR